MFFFNLNFCTSLFHVWANFIKNKILGGKKKNECWEIKELDKWKQKKIDGWEINCGETKKIGWVETKIVGIFFKKLIIGGKC